MREVRDAAPRAGRAGWAIPETGIAERSHL